jgi:hypothetical protein
MTAQIIQFPISIKHQLKIRANWITGVIMEDYEGCNCHVVGVAIDAAVQALEDGASAEDALQAADDIIHRYEVIRLGMMKELK